MSAAPVSIVPGTALDLDAVMRVMEESFDPAFGEAWTSAQCAGLLPLPGVWLSLAKRGDEVLGFALSRIVLDEAELLLLAVRPKGQRQGIGQLLLDRFVLEATRRGATHLHLEVRDGNHAIELYMRSGFSEAGRRYNYYNGRDGQLRDALTLARKIKD
ncbi:ribosomal protein S18-alanine N-acetyltransferase [Allosphingosinicella humi]|jgi:ribosomal-protein-alanine N-acetyltransferase